MHLFTLKNVLWNILKKLANLNLAIFILFLIVFFSILGSVIEQNQDLFFYQMNYPIHSNKFIEFNWQFIAFLGLDNIYESWWFIFILCIFTLSLFVCTFTVQLPSLKYSRRWKFSNFIKKKEKNKNYLGNLFFQSSLENSFINIIYSLNNSLFYVFYKGKAAYAYKGLFGRIGPIFVHASIIITLFGSMLGIFTGFVGQEMVSKGEVFHVKNVVKFGVFNLLPRNVLGRVNDFFITYNLNGSVKQFFSDISILDNTGSIIGNKLISVNSPLLFNHLTFYQTDWNIDGFRLQLNNNYIVQKKVQNIDFNGRKCWLCNFFLDNNNKYILLLFDLQDNIYVYNQNINTISSISLNKSIYLDDIKIDIKDILVSTGLYIKADPGIFIIYSGFFILMLSTVCSYISYTQVWVNKVDKVINFSGVTNRAILFFEEDINKINTIYQKYTFYK
uniref:Cytochrome c biogenesis protein CcsB n=1 Tax=Ptilothamnion sphaericum TaxID=1498216 RepID=A0A4D6WYW3_9FLOR|nr:cytochrome c biogenesis protein ccs1 [Ptilothamnion sphaericum]QCI08329.1 cytochrome c biogenesis protein ccs1 [Ptilothamnion sphaericum]